MFSINSRCMPLVLRHNSPLSHVEGTRKRLSLSRGKCWGNSVRFSASDHPLAEGLTWLMKVSLSCANELYTLADNNYNNCSHSTRNGCCFMIALGPIVSAHSFRHAMCEISCQCACTIRHSLSKLLFQISFSLPLALLKHSLTCEISALCNYILRIGLLCNLYLPL